MATTEELKAKIEKKEADIAKIEKRIAKWEAAKSDKAFAKQYSWLEQNGLWYNRKSGEYDLSFSEFKERNWDEYLGDCDREIKYAQRDLEEANNTLTKYKNALKIKDDQESVEKVPVIVEFLANWKKSVIEFIEEDTKQAQLYYDVDKEYTDLWNGHYRLVPETMSEDEYKDKRAALKEKVEKIYESVNPLTFQFYSPSKKSLDMDGLNKLLDKEVEKKYFSMVNRITEKAGEIKDASHLYISGAGEINGYIDGSKNRVRVETITAGGYNVQILHYRTLVNVIH